MFGNQFTDKEKLTLFIDAQRNREKRLRREARISSRDRNINIQIIPKLSIDLIIGLPGYG